MNLHPEFITEKGRRKFAVLPYKEYLALMEMADDAELVLAYDKAIEEEGDAPTTSLEDFVKEMSAK